MNNKAKRSVAVMALAIICIGLMVAAQPVQSFVFIPLIVFSLSVLAGFVTAYLLDTYRPPRPGITADSALSLFFNSKNNEFSSLTTAMKDEASSLDAMGYYLGRKTEYAAMSYLDDTLYPTYPKWIILNNSIYPELSTMWYNLMQGYTSAAQDAIRYAQESFVGDLSGLDLLGGSTSLKTGSNDLVAGIGWAKHTTGAIGTYSYDIGYIVVTNTSENNYLCAQGIEAASLMQITFADQLSENTTTVTPTTTMTQYVLSQGIWKVTVHGSGGMGGDNWWYYIFTPALMVYRDMSYYSAYGSTYFYSQSRSGSYNPGMYNALNFKDTSGHTYAISTANTTQVYVNGTLSSLDTVAAYANSLAYAYWTTLRNAGIYNASQIPSDQVIPLPDFGFISNDDLAKLNSYEIMAMYLAYLKALGNFFNSTTYKTIINTSFTYANVTFANLGVIVDGCLYRNNTLVTNGSLYIQVYADMDLVVGNNTLNSSGLIYNLNDTACFSYAAGDVLNATSIWVRVPNGTYTQVSSASIKAETIYAYIHTSNSGDKAVPTGGSSSGGSSSGLVLIIAALVVLLILSRQEKGNSSPVNVIMPRNSTSASDREHRPEVQQAIFAP